MQTLWRLVGILSQLPSIACPCLGHGEHFTMRAGASPHLLVPIMAPPQACPLQDVPPHLQRGPGRGGQRRGSRSKAWARGPLVKRETGLD